MPSNLVVASPPVLGRSTERGRPVPKFNDLWDRRYEHRLTIPAGPEALPLKVNLRGIDPIELHAGIARDV